MTSKDTSTTAGRRQSQHPGQAKAVTNLPEEETLQGRVAGELSAQEPATGCPVCGCQPPRPHAALPPGRTGRLVAWLADHHHRPGLRASEIAVAAGVSVRRLQVICQREFGRTPMQLLTDIRLYHAHLTLTSPEAVPPSISDVARSAGFTRVTRFRSAYYRRYGTFPATAAQATAICSPAPEARQQARSDLRPPDEAETVRPAGSPAHPIPRSYP